MAIYPKVRWTVLAAVGALACLPFASLASERIAGPVPAEFLNAVDGDTLSVRADVWLGLEVTTNVRLRGIDAPEIHGRRASEKAMAAEAKDKLGALAGAGAIVLSNVENDKYGGRVLADVSLVDGGRLADLMLKSGLARPYDGGTRGGWCGVADPSP